jgi:hypothetical protein
VCALPPPVRDSIKRMRRDGMVLRDIAAALVAEGHAVSKDTVHRHLRVCVAPPDVVAPEADDRSLLTALCVRDRLYMRSHGLADAISLDLHDLGLVAEAQIVQSAACESMRTALSAVPVGSSAGELLEARCLALAVNRVLSRADPGHADIAHAIADAVQDEGADDLADALRECAARASRLSVGEGAESPGDSTSRSGAVAPPAAGSCPGPSSTTTTKESA